MLCNPQQREQEGER